MRNGGWNDGGEVTCWCARCNHLNAGREGMPLVLVRTLRPDSVDSQEDL